MLCSVIRTSPSSKTAGWSSSRAKAPSSCHRSVANGTGKRNQCRRIQRSQTRECDWDNLLAASKRQERIRLRGGEKRGRGRTKKKREEGARRLREKEKGRSRRRGQSGLSRTKLPQKTLIRSWTEDKLQVFYGAEISAFLSSLMKELRVSFPTLLGKEVNYRKTIFR